MNPNIIAGLIKRAYSNFDMYSFDNRLKFQKFAYILQFLFGLNLGYEFNWYIHGPYSIQLTKDGFNVDFTSIQQIKFGNPSSEKKFEQFLDFIKDKNNFWLEVVASIHYLKKLGYSEEKIIEIIKSKQVEYNDKGKEISEILNSLKGGKFLNG